MKVSNNIFIIITITVYGFWLCIVIIYIFAAIYTFLWWNRQPKFRYNIGIENYDQHIFILFKIWAITKFTSHGPWYLQWRRHNLNINRKKEGLQRELIRFYLIRIFQIIAEDHALEYIILLFFCQLATPFIFYF